MTFQEYVLIGSAIVNIIVSLGIWKIYQEYKSYYKEANWKDLKEYYDTVKIPRIYEEIERDVRKNLDIQFKEVISPQIQQLSTPLHESVLFASEILIRHYTKEQAKEIVQEKMPSCEQFLQKIWA